ncbi:caspase recruitment domain-containing protein 10 isoform X2 [Lepisosteus oculatus]|uniref:caspase recruitment domain-containing protein 10 isoform X2 n=1 Tax=Lepisosteus oculatus TaxID=7918 RepID=UPI0035F50663
MCDWVSMSVEGTGQPGQQGSSTEAGAAGAAGAAAPPWGPGQDEELWDRVDGVRHRLTRLLHPAKLTPYLRQCKVIDEQDEDEILNSPLYPLRINKAGRLIDILRQRGQRGLQAFMESLEFYHPDQYTQLTGQEPTQRCSIILDEEGPEGLTQFLLLELRKLREQLRGSRLCERRLSQRCRAAEEERARAERRAQELAQERRAQELAQERHRLDWEAGRRELGLLKDRHLEQVLKYSRALEERGLASARERELLAQVEQLKKRLMALEQGESAPPAKLPLQGDGSRLACGEGAPAGQEDSLHRTDRDRPREGSGKTQALLDILRQDQEEAQQQRLELCSTIARLQGELEASEKQKDKLVSQCEHLQLKVHTLQLDWETEQKRSISYLNQIIELERERDQALRSRDVLQLEHTECLLDKNRLRKQVAELLASQEQLQRDREQLIKSSEEPCLHCSQLSLFSDEPCSDLCCSFNDRMSLPEDTSWGSSHPDSAHPPLRKAVPRRNRESSDGSCSNSEEFIYLQEMGSEKDINRLSIFPFPPCLGSMHRRATTDFDLDSWGSDECAAEDHSEPSLSASCSSLASYTFPPDLVTLPKTAAPRPPLPDRRPEPLLPSPTSSRQRSLADDITIVGGNCTGIFVQSVKAGSRAEQCGLREGSELLELQRVLLGGASLQLRHCTLEVAHFSLQWWTEPAALRHQPSPEAYASLRAQADKPGPAAGFDSFYIRVNLDLNPQGPPPCLGAHADDILHVTDTLHRGKCQWHCARVELQTGKDLEAGVMPSYNRAQQLLLVRLRTLAREQEDRNKKFSRKARERVRLVKAVSPHCRGMGSAPQVHYTLSQRHEENLIPYSLVQPVLVQSKRPVVFSPSLLSHGLIVRLLQPASSGLEFNTCPPEPISAADRQDQKVFLLESPGPEQSLGIRLQSIQEVISQDKHCLLELGLGSVERLLRQGVYPIVIHIKPKDKKGRKFRKLVSERGDEGLLEAVCQAEELQLETLPLLYHTLEPGTWRSTEELLAAVRRAIGGQQRAMVWVEPDKLQ